jgi:hypothetical protein
MVAVAVILGACQQPAASTSAGDTVFVAGTKIGTAPPNTNDGEWSMPARDYANSRYSGLAQITPDNAKNPEGLVDVLDRRVARARRTAARRRQHDVSRDALPERVVRARSHTARIPAQVEVPSRKTRRRRSAWRAATL